MVQYPHVFEDAVLDNIKNWVMDESASFSSENQSLKHDLGRNEVSDSEMLKTYSTGLLAVCLSGYESTVDSLFSLFMIVFPLL